MFRASLAQNQGMHGSIKQSFNIFTISSMYRPVEMWWHTRRNQISSFGETASPFKSAGVSVQSTTDSRGVRISGSNVGYTMFQRSVKGTGYPLHSTVSLSIPLQCVTMCQHISTGLYQNSHNFPCTYTMTTNHPLTKLRQFCYTLEKVKMWKYDFMQLCTPWWWTSEAWSM